MSSSSTRKKRKIHQSPTKNPHQNLPHEEQDIKDQKPITSVPYIPTPIVFEILSRVPVKTLFSCRLVCRNWAALISTPEFAQLHLSRSPTSCLIKPLNKKLQSERLHLVDPERPHCIHNKLVFVPKINLPNVPLGLLNSCNGLVCLAQVTSLDSINSCNIFVCNPVLREYITLPEITHIPEFDSFNCAFGFSHKTNQYKVVLSSYCTNSTPNFRTDIYTLGQGSWRRIENAPYYISNQYYNAFLNGALHWLESHSSRPFFGCFDFVTEQFRAFPEPSDFGLLENQFWFKMWVGVMNGNLSIGDFSSHKHIDIWVMKDYGVKESWSKDIVINHMIYETIRDTYESIMITGSGEILMIFNNNSIMLYDPKSKAFEAEFKIFGVGSRFHGIAHVPSLISLKDVAKGENVKRDNG